MIILRNKNFAYSRGYHTVAKFVGGRNAVRAKRVGETAKEIAADPVTPTMSLVHEQVSSTKDAPLVMISSKFSPVPGTSVAAAKKKIGNTGKTAVQHEGQLWDNLGVGRVTRPFRRKMDQVLTRDRFVGAGQGMYNNLKLMAGVPVS